MCSREAHGGHGGAARPGARHDAAGVDGAAAGPEPRVRPAPAASVILACLCPGTWAGIVCARRPRNGLLFLRNDRAGQRLRRWLFVRDPASGQGHGRGLTAPAWMAPATDR